jgi:hypothetical protein
MDGAWARGRREFVGVWSICYVCCFCGREHTTFFHSSLFPRVIECEQRLALVRALVRRYGQLGGEVVEGD